MSRPVQYHGGLVAFEGSTDLISTQLRLLPTSPQISILPPVHAYLEDAESSERFDARKLIKRMHLALAARNEAAYTFLREATPNNKRLVFMNGGTPSAQSFCIKAIADNETDGDIAHAELLFNNLVKHGLAGLEVEFVSRRGERQHHTPEEDPITRAMRAADALDRMTANLQPNTDVDLTIATRPRSMSLPMYSFDDRFGDSAPFYVFGVRSEEEDNYDEDGLPSPFMPATPRLEVTDFGHIFPSVLSPSLDTIGSFPVLRSPSCVGEAYDHPVSPRTQNTTDMLSPISAYSIHSAEPAIYGEASVVHMGSSARRRSVKRIKSLDRTYLNGARYRDTVLRIQTQSEAIGEQELPVDGRRYSSMEAAAHEPPHLNIVDLEGQRTVYARGGRPMIKLLAPPKFKKKTRSTYVDKGTDAEEVPVLEPPFQPVLPFTEDLVINFKDGDSDFTLEAIIRAFKAGIYPVQMPAPSEHSLLDDKSIPGTPDLLAVYQDHDDIDAEVSWAGFNPSEYDPFAYGPTLLKSTVALPCAPKRKPSTPPTPAQTPPLPADHASLEEKFRDCDIMACKTAVAVQNSLRIILNIHFPPEDQGYHHFHFSILPEMGGLWKPVFREADPESPRCNRRRIDQILAIGSQRGVKKTYLSSVVEHLERLGSKTGEVSRSGRLDFRYLVANAMQAFTAQPLANQTHDNPFTNPYLLATLIIPHLEPYFVIHDEVRFLLLEYPPDHLATVLALQKLVGVDLMKVAAIVDSDAKGPLPFSHIRGASITQVKEGSRSESASPRGKSPCNKSSSATLSESVSVSKANFLLTSTATEEEIANFVSTIRKLLIEVSRFYVPEEPLRLKANKRVPNPLSGTFSPFPRPTTGLQSPPLSPPPLTLPPPPKRHLPPRPPSPTVSTKASSFVDTTRTIRSIRSRRSKSRKSGGTFGPVADRHADTTSLFTIDFEDDSDYDQEERRLMPIFLSKPPSRRGDTRKALKFLGLA